MCLIKSLKDSFAELRKYLERDAFALFGDIVEVDATPEEERLQSYLDILSSGRMISEEAVIKLFTDYARKYNAATGCDRNHQEKVFELAANVFSPRFVLLPIFSNRKHVYTVKRYLDRPIVAVFSPEKLVVCMWDIQDIQYSDGTLLAKLDDTTYLFVGNTVYEFETFDTGFQWFQGGDYSVLYQREYAYLLSAWYTATDTNAVEVYHWMDREQKGTRMEMTVYDGIVHFPPFRRKNERRETHERRDDAKEEDSEYTTIINDDGEEEYVRNYELVVNEDGEEEYVKR